jgi:uncharacterized membrane protein YvlD (DUF360 family)
MRLLLGWAINAGVLLLLPYLIPAVQINDFVTALMVALVLGLLNAIVRPLLVILTLPITLLSLGLFLFVINGLMFWLAFCWPLILEKSELEWPLAMASRAALGHSRWWPVRPSPNGSLPLRPSSRSGSPVGWWWACRSTPMVRHTRLPSAASDLLVSLRGAFQSRSFLRMSDTLPHWRQARLRSTPRPRPYFCKGC